MKIYSAAENILPEELLLLSLENSVFKDLFLGRILSPNVLDRFHSYGMEKSIC